MLESASYLGKVFDDSVTIVTTVKNENSPNGWTKVVLHCLNKNELWDTMMLLRAQPADWLSSVLGLKASGFSSTVGTVPARALDSYILDFVAKGGVVNRIVPAPSSAKKLAKASVDVDALLAGLDEALGEEESGEAEAQSLMDSPVDICEASSGESAEPLEGEAA